MEGEVGDPSRSTPMLVLIVEDEGPIAQALTDIVAECGHVPLVAVNGKQALERIQEQSPSLIITDWMMPVMSGGELIAAIQKHYAQMDNRPPIILMSAIEQRLAQQSGADAFLPKPFGFDDVEVLLQQYIPTNFNDDVSPDDTREGG